MGFFDKIRKKKKDIAHIGDVARAGPKKDAVKVGKEPLKEHEIKEIDFQDTEVEVPEVGSGDEVGAEGTEGGGFDAFEIGTDELPGAEGGGEMAEGDGEPVATLSLADATQVAKKYLIVHAQAPNSVMSSRSNKRENGEFYFEFRDRELHQVTISPRGEVIEWNREKL